MSNSLRNMVLLDGNVGADPEVKHFPSGACVAKFPLATNQRWKDKKSNDWKEKTVWTSIECWADHAEAIERKVRKGTNISILGELDNEEYEDKDGKKVYRTFIKMREYIIRETKKN